jgi:hypothetical protein
MSAEAKRAQEPQLPVPSPQGQALVDQILQKVFEVDLSQSLPVVEYFLNSLDPQETGVDYHFVRSVIQSLWNLFAGVRSGSVEGNWVEALTRLESAAREFDQLSQAELRDLSIGMCAYCQAVVEIQHKNIGRAMELFAKQKEYLRNAGKFSNKFEELIAHSEPEAMFVSAVNALMAYDWATGRTLVERAAKAAEDAAQKYHEKGDKAYNTMQGMACYFRAYYVFLRASADFSLLDYHTITGKQDLAREARQAKALLDAGNLGNDGIKKVDSLSTTLINLLEAISQLARIMQSIFSATFKPDLIVLSEIRGKIRSAGDSAAEAGEDAVAMVRHCEQLGTQVDNLEKLAKPNKKDFGILSGLVACAGFAVLFLITSWANSAFELGVDASKLLYACTSLGLVGGFGYGAVRFRSMFFKSS